MKIYTSACVSLHGKISMRGNIPTTSGVGGGDPYQGVLSIRIIATNGKLTTAEITPITSNGWYLL